jgi:hypothetical protein
MYEQLDVRWSYVPNLQSGFTIHSSGVSRLLLLHVICGGGTFIDDGASSPGELLHGPVGVAAAAAFSVDLIGSREGTPKVKNEKEYS